MEEKGERNKVRRTFLTGWSSAEEKQEHWPACGTSQRTPPGSQRPLVCPAGGTGRPGSSGWCWLWGCTQGDAQKSTQSRNELKNKSSERGLTCWLCRPCTSRRTLRTGCCLCVCPGSKSHGGGRKTKRTWGEVVVTTGLVTFFFYPLKVL